MWIGGESLILKISRIGEAFSTGLKIYERIADRLDYDDGFGIIFLKEDDRYGYKEIREIQKKEDMIYLFKSTKGNLSYSNAPTVKLQGSDNADKRAIERLMNFFNHDRTRNLYEAFKESRIDIENDLLKYDRRKNHFLTVLIQKDHDLLYPADVEEIVDVFKERVLEKTKEERNRCFLCGREVESYTYLNRIFKFSTFDKPGFTPLLKKEVGSVVAICEDCRLNLEYGRTIVEKHLSFRFFGGDTLWIIPDVDELDLLKETVNYIGKSELLEKGGRTNFANVERDLENYLSRRSAHYDFIFLSISNNAEKIQLHITEISPTRLKKMVDLSNEFKERAEEINLHFEDPTIGKIWELFQKPKTKNPGKKQFYELVDSLFSGKSFSRDVFLMYVMRTIRTNLYENSFSEIARSAFFAYMYLRRMGIFSDSGGEEMELSGFFEKFPEFFDKPWKKAIFLLGVITGKLLDIQAVERGGNKPFLKKLKGLKMRKNEILALLPELRNKFEQYGRMSKYYEKLFEEASENIIKAGNWNAGIDEINFVFSVGMSLRNVLNRGEEDEGNGEEQV
ncbi:MAG TPA: TIGR02556 family CRISPR-associated protein [Thermotogales bacterium]|nr:TIGR02556 family CRISPR-associated protein [Thermotogales bacterium]